MSEPIKGAIDWKKVRDERVPPVAEDDPALQLIQAQLAALDKYPPLPGNIPGMQKTWTEARDDLRLQLEEEMARYRYWKAGYFNVTREMLDACRSEEE